MFTQSVGNSIFLIFIFITEKLKIKMLPKSYAVHTVKKYQAFVSKHTELRVWHIFSLYCFYTKNTQIFDFVFFRPKVGEYQNTIPIQLWAGDRSFFLTVYLFKSWWTSKNIKRANKFASSPSLRNSLPLIDRPAKLYVNQRWYWKLIRIWWRHRRGFFQALDREQSDSLASARWVLRVSE